MTDPIYVILVDGRPRRKDSAIRTYKTQERAEQEAQKIAGYWFYRDSKLEVATFRADIITEVAMPPRTHSSPPMPRPEVSAE